MFAHFRSPFALCSQVQEPLKEDETCCLVLHNSSVTCSSSRFACDYVSIDVRCHNQCWREHIGNWHISLLSLPPFSLKQTPGSGELKSTIMQVVHPISLVYCHSATPSCLHLASSRIQTNWPLLAQYNIVWVPSSSLPGDKHSTILSSISYWPPPPQLAKALYCWLGLPIYNKLWCNLSLAVLGSSSCGNGLSLYGYIRTVVGNTPEPQSSGAPTMYSLCIHDPHCSISPGCKLWKQQTRAAPW